MTELHKTFDDLLRCFGIEKSVLTARQKYIAEFEFNIWNKLLNLEKSIDIKKLLFAIEENPKLKNLLSDILIAYARIKATDYCKDPINLNFSSKGKNVIIITDFLDEKFFSVFFSSLFNGLVAFLIFSKKFQDEADLFMAMMRATFFSLDRQEISQSFVETFKNTFNLYFPQLINHDILMDFYQSGNFKEEQTATI